MGGGSSKNKNDVISSNKKRNQSLSRSPPLRGTSRSPPEAWDTRSEPDTRSTKESEPDDWRNVTNTSYNLLDLDPFYNGDIESTSPPQPASPLKKKKIGSPKKKRRSRSSSTDMKNKRSLSSWRSPSPSPERKKKSPSPRSKRSYDKYRDFRNLTQERDQKLRSISPNKGKPYHQGKRSKSPEKKVTKSPEKKVNSSNKNYYEKDYDKSYDKGYEKSYDKNYSDKQHSYSKSPEKHLPALRNNKAKYGINSSLSNSHGKTEKSPYEERHASPVKKTKLSSSFNKENNKYIRRRNSLPDLEVPTKHPTSTDKFKKPTKNKTRRVSPTRRSSDVSTIGLEEKPVFRPIRNGKPPKQPKSADPLETLFPKPKSNTSYTTQLSEPSRQNSKQSNKSQLLNKRRITPNSLPTTAKVYGKSKSPMSRGTSHGSIGSELSFSNIATLKSASNSVQSGVSARSNFEINAKIDRFNDKKQTLALMDLGKHTVLNNSFRDSKMPGGPQPVYEQAKKDLKTDEWETELAGIEKIVTIARKAPEVLRNDIKECVNLMVAELKNLRSQVCRAAALAWAELFLALGKGLEPYVDKVADVLLQKSADTNKFIREGCIEALLALVENISVNKAVTTVCESGINHKSVVVKAQTAKLLDHVITAIGPERFYGSSKDTQICVLTKGTKMLSDGSLDVRTYAKHMFGVLANHANFEPLMKEVIPENDIKHIRKTLDAIMNQM